MAIDINGIKNSIREANNSVDRLMGLVDSGILTKDAIWSLADIWDELTLIPFEYARYLAEDNLEQLVKTVVADYDSAYTLGNYVWAMFLHKSNKWMSQIIGAAEYQVIDEIFTRYEEPMLDGEIVEFFDGVSSYKELIERAGSAKKDISRIVVKVEEARLAGDFSLMYSLIKEGLEEAPCNHELLFALGEYYMENEAVRNADMGYLCFENSLHHCSDRADAIEIEALLNSLRSDVNVRKTAIVIVSYNLNYMLQKNIEQIRTTLPTDSYRIIVVDNASDDGVYEWLKEQEDILLLRNEKNVGFGIACNQGVELLTDNSDEDYDILLLNNDTRLAENSLFWLRMGLYGNDTVGVTGSLSNYAGNEQQVDVEFATPGDYLEYGKKNNIPMDNAYEERVRLSGFAMLIRNGLWDKACGMDPIFAPGYFEDDDLCMKIREKGHKLVLCRNSFIYHAGSQSFGKLTGINTLLQGNYIKFIDKYGIEINDYAYPNRELVSRIITPDNGGNVLFYGSGLGADMAYIAAECPMLSLWGIEEDDRLRKYSCCSERVVRDICELTDIRFDYVFINKKRANCQEDTEKKLTEYIKPGTVIVEYSYDEDRILSTKYVDFDKIKLIIWDLDETFWKGTISEERVVAIPENIALIKTLADRGIINSISSKNDRDVAMERLADMGVAEYFVFADINWEGKGSQISDKLKAMNLRAENTLFIDDNVANLSEAAFFADGIMTGKPDIIPKLIAYYSELPETDAEHKRLIQYRVLEEKQKKEKSFESRDEFLLFSNIKVEIHDDCVKELDRITEMVMRTNQLNYTKLRSDKDAIEACINDDKYNCGYVTVSDRFGSYGIIGFYALDTARKELTHFLFSCRVMGMGVEQYVYNLLDKPSLNVRGEVAVRLEQDKETPWINMANAESLVSDSDTNKKSSGKLLLKGPCDLATMENFIAYDKMATEFNYVNDKGVITAGQNHSVNIIESLELTEEEIQELLVSAPIVCRGDFETNMFTGDYEYICYSLLPDCHTGLYCNKRTGHLISFGSKNYDITNPELWSDLCLGKIVNHSYPFTKDMLIQFMDEWEFVGCTPIEILIDNLNTIYSRLPDYTKLILILGSEIESEEVNGEFDNHAYWHTLVNREVEKFASDKDRIVLINPTKYIKSQNDFAGCTNHYSRNVYYEMANEINSFISGKNTASTSDVYIAPIVPVITESDECNGSAEPEFGLDFFRDEIRNGFYIVGAVKQAWAASMKVLLTVDKICRENGITYFAHWGTLLGAIRHGGYIPWDDDIDICMKRADYIRFKEIAPALLPKEYCIHDYRTKDNHWLFLARVVNNSHICFEPEHLEKNYNCPYLAGIDIFVMDYRYEDSDREEMRIAEVKELLAVADMYINNSASDETRKKKLQEFSIKYGVPIDASADNIEIARELYELTEKQLGRTSREEANAIVQSFPYGLLGKQIMPRDAYDKVITVQFENMCIPAMEDYNTVLTRLYGDYMTPVMNAADHAYPYFEGQRNNLKLVAENGIEEFAFAENMLRQNHPYNASRVTVQSVIMRLVSGWSILQNHCIQAVSKGDYEQIRALLPDCQDTAVEIGDYIEKTLCIIDDSYYEIVALIEEYCESLFCIFEGLHNEENIACEEIEYRGRVLQDIFEQVTEKISTYVDKRRIVLFLPDDVNNWKLVSHLYDRCVRTDNVLPVVIPMPIFKKTPFGEIVADDYELDNNDRFEEYPCDIRRVKWDHIDISQYYFDEIYIQNQYDNENGYLTIPNMYYASVVREYTDKLIYVLNDADVEEFELDNVSCIYGLKYRLCMPGAMYADSIMCSNRNMMDKYRQYIAEYVGEQYADNVVSRLQYIYDKD